MSNTKPKATFQELDNVLNFVDTSTGLVAKANESGNVKIEQKLDGKSFSFHHNEIAEVLHREDADGKPFVQINFKTDVKVLLTDNLVGFKPSQVMGLDMARLPKVVTTPDLSSVLDAIEESMGGESSLEQEVEILKKVFQAIILGGERIGFTLEKERAVLDRLLASRFRAAG